MNNTLKDIELIKLVKFKKYNKKFLIISTEEFNTQLDHIEFQNVIENIYLESKEFIKENKGKKIFKSLNLLLLWEFILKAKVTDAYAPIMDTSIDSDETKGNLDNLVFNMAWVNNYRNTLVDNITDWIINRFEFANENYQFNKKNSENVVKNTKKVINIFEKSFKKYFDLKIEIQENTYTDIRYTLNKAIEIGYKLYKNSPKGEKFARM
ncbi:MAG: hypothetical protein HeimC3_15650 [Candidatus Heimdallarchaeota archaeon LC_3]|nr:MAG: hypothetical protein HeimC3_15650 [Candidatus Heimdallarchaeota archaeon LC_3]